MIGREYLQQVRRECKAVQALTERLKELDALILHGVRYSAEPYRGGNRSDPVARYAIKREAVAADLAEVTERYLDHCEVVHKVTCDMSPELYAVILGFDCMAMTHEELAKQFGKEKGWSKIKRREALVEFERRITGLNLDLENI